MFWVAALLVQRFTFSKLEFDDKQQKITAVRKNVLADFLAWYIQDPLYRFLVICAASMWLNRPQDDDDK